LFVEGLRVLANYSSGFLLAISHDLADPWQKAGDFHEIPVSSKFKLFISKDGQLYLLALDDFSLPPSEPLYIIKGKYKLGQQATAVMKASQNWVSGELTSDTLVALVVLAEPSEKVQVTVPAIPARMETCLQALAEAGFVRVRLNNHEITRLDGTHKYKVVAASPTAMEIPVIEAKEGKEAAKASVHNIASFLDVAVIRKSPHLQIVYKVQYETTKNRLGIGYPQASHVHAC